MQQYKRAWALLHQCFTSLSLKLITSRDLPLSVPQVALFVSFLHRLGYSPASVLSYTSALGYVHRLAGCGDPTSSVLVQKLIAGATRLSPKSDPRLPITLLMLDRLVEAVSNTIPTNYHKSMVRAMLVIGFFGLMRIGELTQSKHGEIPVKIDQVTLCHDKVIIRITHFKQEWQSVT